MKTYTKRALSWVLAVSLLITCGISGLVLPSSAEASATPWAYEQDFEGAVDEWKVGAAAAAPQAEADGVDNKVIKLSGNNQNKAYLTLDKPLEAGKQYLFRVMAKNLTGVSTTLYFAPPTGSVQGRSGITDTDWIGYQYLYTCTTADTDGFEVSFASDGAEMIIDDVEAYEIHSELNLAHKGDMSAKGYLFSKGYASGWTHEKEGDNDVLKVPAGTTKKYFQMYGMTHPGVYEVSFDYKGPALNPYFTTGSALWQSAKSATTEWKRYTMYFNLTSSSTAGRMMLSNSNTTTDLYLDNFSIRLLSLSLTGDSSVLVGNTMTLTPVIAPADAVLLEKKSLTWASADETIATVANGVVTGVAVGTTTITATLNNLSATYEVMVKDPSSAPALTGITLNKTAETIVVGNTATLIATGTPEDASMAGLVWESSDTDIATVEGGVITAVKAGAATITAKVGDISATCEITVENPNLFVNGDFEQGASVNWGNNARVQEGIGRDGSWGYYVERAEGSGEWDTSSGMYYKGKLFGSLKPNTKYILSFDYKHTGGGVPQVYLVYDLGTGEDGKQYGPTTKIHIEPAGGETDWTTYTLTVTTNDTISSNTGWELNVRSRGTAGTTYYDNFKLVEAPEEKNPTLTGLTLDKTTVSVEVGKTETLTATAVPAGADISALTWETSDAAVATVTNGVVTGVAAGTATITAKVGDITATCAVTVTAPAPTLTGITLDKTTATVTVGSTVTLTATAVPAGADISALTWETSDAAVATVANGVVTGVAAGTATITAKVGSITATCAVTVNPAVQRPQTPTDPNALIVNGDFEADAAIGWKGSTQYIQEGVGKDGSWGIGWEHTHDGVGNWIYGPYYNGTNLTAGLKPNTKYILEFDYKSEGAGFLQLYNYDKFSVEFTQGKGIEIPDSADWKKYTYIFTTTATIPTSWYMPFYFRYIMYGNASGTGTGKAAVDNITLTEVPVATAIALDKETASVKVGKTFTLAVSTEPAVATKPVIVWTTSDAAVATVTDGVVTGVAAGTATITATAGELTDSCVVTIVPDDGNLFENGDFEQGADISWGGSKWVQAGVGKDGSYGVKIETTVDENTTSHQTPGFYYKDALVSKLETDTVYELSFDYKHEGKGFGAFYLAKDFGTIEGSGKDFYAQVDQSSGEVDWKTVKIIFFTPSEKLSASKGNEFLMRHVQYNTAANMGSGAVYFDNLKIVKVRDVVHADKITLAPSTLELLPGASGTVKVMTTPEGAATGILTYTTSDATIATVDKNGKVTSTGKEGEAVITVTNDKNKTSQATVKVTKNANLIKNGDFEQGGEHWGNHENVQNGIGKDGGWGLKMQTGGKAIYYKTSLSTMQPSTSYILTFDYKKPRGTSFRVWSADSFGATIAKFDTTYDEWETMSLVFTTAPNLSLNTGWDICFVGEAEGPDGERAVVDNIVLRRYDSDVQANSINFNKSELTLIPGRTDTLSMVADPKNANLNDTVWTSSDDNVATVEYGVVTAVGKGTATITATTINGKTATCKVTVSGDEAYIKNGTFDNAADTNWQLKDGAEIVAGEGRLGTAAAKLTKGQSLVYTVTGLKPDTEYQLSLKSRTSSGALNVTLVDGETTLLSDKTGTSSGWATKTFEFKTPADCSGTATLTLAPAGNGPVYVDNVRLNVKASLVDFIVSDLFWMGGGYQVTPGTELKFGVTVTNQGEDPVKAGQVVVVELRKNGTAFMTLETELKEDLETGGSVIFASDESWFAEEGHLVISARANPALSILEMVDTNNTTQKNLRVDDEILEAPQVAQDAGFTDLTFSDEFDSLNSIDMYASGDDGYKWYVTRQWEATTITPDCYSINDGIISLHSTQPGYHVTLSTVDVNTEIGYTWNKGYLEVLLRIPNKDPGEDGVDYDGSPAIWSFPDTKWLEKKGENYKWVEMDWLEYWGVTASRPGGYYTITFHDQHNKTADQDAYWYSNSNAYREGLGDEEWHVMGWLWAENAVISYVDGKEVQRITYKEGELPSCRLSMHDSVDLDATSAYTLMNDLFNVLYVSGGKDFPLELDYVRIWQGGTGIIDLPGEEEKPAVDVDANEFWYYYCTDNYGDNIVEINEENYSIVLDGAELWAQLSEARKAEINALLAAKGQPSFDDLLAAAQAFANPSPDTGATTALPVAFAMVTMLSGAVMVTSRKRKNRK